MSTPTFNTRQGANDIELIVQGDLKAQHAEIFRNFLLGSSNRTIDERLVLKKVDALDVSAIQLMWLWKKALAEQGRQTTIEWPENKAVRDLLENCGVTKIF